MSWITRIMIALMKNHFWKRIGLRNLVCEVKLIRSHYEQWLNHFGNQVVVYAYSQIIPIASRCSAEVQDIIVKYILVFNTLSSNNNIKIHMNLLTCSCIHMTLNHLFGKQTIQHFLNVSNHLGSCFMCLQSAVTCNKEVLFPFIVLSGRWMGSLDTTISLGNLSTTSNWATMMITIKLHWTRNMLKVN